MDRHHGCILSRAACRVMLCEANEVVDDVSLELGKPQSVINALALLVY